ncbi:hypothetical protein [Streptomyces fumanus]|nr:hypothetical protein [Streptomyces fumanus]
MEELIGRPHQQASEVLIEAERRPRPVVRLLALPYSDRPGHRAARRP